MAEVKTVEISRGVTIEKNGVYHKFNCGLEIELSEGDDPQKCREKGWNTVERELERKIDELDDE